jgi:hypothetical protein
MVRSKLNLGIGTTKRNGQNLLTRQLEWESARATVTSRRSIKAKKSLDDIIGKRRYKIPTKYGVLYINEDTDPRKLEGLNAEALERNILSNIQNQAGKTHIKEVKRINNKDNVPRENGVLFIKHTRYDKAVKFKGYKKNNYIEEWQMPEGSNINSHSREPNFVIVTETKASKRKGGLGMKDAQKFICEDPDQMNEFKEYPPFDRFKLNRLLAVGRWGMMEGHDADPAAEERGIKTAFRGIKDYEILKHKADIVRKNRLASWYMEEVYSKKIGILDRLRQMHEDRRNIFKKVRSFQERMCRTQSSESATQSNENEGLVQRSSTSSRELPLAPYRSRQTVAELLRTCRDIEHIPERKQLRFGTTGLGKFNGEGKSSLIDKLLKGLQASDFHDDHAFLIQRDFVVSRPLHETKNKPNINNVVKLFHSGDELNNNALEKAKKANLELMGAVFPTPHDKSDNRILRDFECLPKPNADKNDKNDGNYPNPPRGGYTTFCQAVRRELYEMERIGALKDILTSKSSSIFFDVMADNGGQRGTHRLAIPREFRNIDKPQITGLPVHPPVHTVQAGGRGEQKRLLLDGYIENMRDGDKIFMEEGKRQYKMNGGGFVKKEKQDIKNSTPKDNPSHFAEIDFNGNPVCVFKELGKEYVKDVYGWHRQVVDASLKLRTNASVSNVSNNVHTSIKKLFTKKLPFVSVSKYNIIDHGRAENPARDGHVANCITRSDTYQEVIDKMHSSTPETAELPDLVVSNNSKDGRWVNIEWGYLRFPHLYFLFIINVYNETWNETHQRSDHRVYDPRVYSASKKDYMKAMRLASVHKRDFLFTMMNLCYCPYSKDVKNTFRGHSLDRGRKSNDLYKGDLISMSRCIPSFISTTDVVRELREFSDETQWVTECAKKILYSKANGATRSGLLRSFAGLVPVAIAVPIGLAALQVAGIGARIGRRPRPQFPILRAPLLSWLRAPRFSTPRWPRRHRRVDPFPVFDSLEKIPNKPNIDPFPARHVSEANDPNKQPNKPNIDPFPARHVSEPNKKPKKPNIDPFPARHVSERNDPNKKPNKPNKLNNVPKNDPKNPKLYNILNGIPASNTNLPRARREPEGYLMLKYFVDEHIVRHLRGPARRSARSMASMMER